MMKGTTLQRAKRTLGVVALSATVFVSSLQGVLAAPLYKETLAMAGIFPWVSQNNWKQSIARAKSWGYIRARIDMKWDMVETTQGQYNFSLFDNMYNELTAQGMTPIFILCYNNRFYSPTGSVTSNGNQVGITDANNRQGYVNFVKAAANRYKGKGVIWEIWNEPDLPKFWNNPNPQAYAQLAQASVQAIRSVDPNAYVINGGFANKSQRKEYIRQAMAAGMLNGYNAMAVHGYDAINWNQGPEFQEGLHAEFRQWMQQYNGGKVLPIVDSEIGVPPQWLNPQRFPDRMDGSAKMMIRITLDNYYDQVYMTAAYGMNDPGELDLSKDSPVTKALQYTNSLLYNLEGTNQNLGQNTRSILFKSRNGSQPDVLAFWATSGQRSISFSSPRQIQGVYDVYGNRRANAGTVNGYSMSEVDGPLFMVMASSSPAPAPQPGPSPAPQPAPSPAPQPAPSPAPQPAPSPAPQPAPSPAPQPAPSPAPQPAPSPAPQPAPSPAPQPAPSPPPQPAPSPGSPQAPSNLSGVVFRDSSQLNRMVLRLNWNDNSNNEQRFEIQRGTSPTQFQTIGTVNANTTTADLMLGFVHIHTYYYRIRAVNSSGQSFSNVITVAPGNVQPNPPAPSPGPAPAPQPAPSPAPQPAPAPAPQPAPSPAPQPAPSPAPQPAPSPGGPTAPSNLNGQMTKDQLGRMILQLAWQDNSNNEQRFDIQRSRTQSNFQTIGSVGPNTSSSNVSLGFTNLYTYHYRIRAVNGSGESFSNILTIPGSTNL